MGATLLRRVRLDSKARLVQVICLLGQTCPSEGVPLCQDHWGKTLLRKPLSFFPHLGGHPLWLQVLHWASPLAPPHFLWYLSRCPRMVAPLRANIG